MAREPAPIQVISIQRARTLLIGATLLWGMSFPLLRGLQLGQKAAAHMPDRTLACADMAVRFGLAALVLLPFYGRHLGNITAREWSQGLGLGLLAGVGLYLQTLGLAWTDASISAFLTQLYTLLVPLIVAGRDRRWPTLRIWIACTMVLVGVALLSPGLLTHFTIGPGELITILSACFFAVQIVWVERPIYAENRSGVVTIIMFALVAGMFGTAYPFMGGTLSLTAKMFAGPALWELTFSLVLFCTVLNFFIMNTWQRLVSATEAGLIYCLEPVIATVICSFLPGWISRLARIDYPNETLRWGLLVGGLLIVGATVLAATQRRD
jgi:drug/metabolite transporter (DMT)-like permease